MARMTDVAGDFRALGIEVPRNLGRRPPDFAQKLAALPNDRNVLSSKIAECASDIKRISPLLLHSETRVALNAQRSIFELKNEGVLCCQKLAKVTKSAPIFFDTAKYIVEGLKVLEGEDQKFVADAANLFRSGLIHASNCLNVEGRKKFFQLLEGADWLHPTFKAIVGQVKDNLWYSFRAREVQSGLGLTREDMRKTLQP